MNDKHQNERAEPRIGVYVCHCGTNIAGTIDVEEVANFGNNLRGVVVSRDYSYMCSDPGQRLIKDDIREFREILPGQSHQVEPGVPARYLDPVIHLYLKRDILIRHLLDDLEQRICRQGDTPFIEHFCFYVYPHGNFEV